MKFFVTPDVFAALPSACFGVVVARGIDNATPNPDVVELLAQTVASVRDAFQGRNVKDAASVAPYRAAFVALGMNPNKFPSSIEAMTSRIAKGKGFPSINPAVDLGNAVSLTYGLPMGAHDIEAAAADISVRFSAGGERFVPFGETEAEILEPGELIYGVGDEVKTRRWIWRQSEVGKVTLASRSIFFPIDGFTDANKDTVLDARDDLAAKLGYYFGAEVTTGFVDAGAPEFAI